MKGGWEGRREGERRGRGRGSDGKMERGRGREGRREDETGGKRTSKGGDSKHNITCIDNSATYPWDIAHTNIHIHPPFQSGPLLILEACMVFPFLFSIST